MTSKTGQTKKPNKMQSTLGNAYLLILPKHLCLEMKLKLFMHHYNKINNLLQQYAATYSSQTK